MIKVSIEKIEGKYKVSFSYKSQSFILDYEGTKKECKWIKEQLEKMFEKFKEDCKNDIFKKIKCKKNLYKSTYKTNAFSKGREYEVISIEKKFIWLKDNLGNLFNFSINKEFPSYWYYWIKEYFEY